MKLILPHCRHCRHCRRSSRASRALLSLALLAPAALMLAGCGQPPIQTGSDHVPDGNVELARVKDAKFETMAWPLVDDIFIDWLDGPFAPGCVVGVAVDGQLTYLRGYGRARLGLSAEDWSVGSMGTIGSVAKFFTATAAMRQVEDGWLDLEARTSDWLPSSGDLANARLYRLLSHSSGVGGGSKGAAFAPNWDDGPVASCAGVPTPDPTDPECTEAHRLSLDPTWLVDQYNDAEADNVASLDAVDVDGDDDTDGWAAIYSNVGYTVLGGIVGAVAQQHGYAGYEDYVWRRVGRWSDNPLTPGQATSLALTHLHRANDIPHRAIGYYDALWGNGEDGAKDWESGELWETVSDGGHWVGPSGAWALTIGDLTRLMIAFRANHIVSGATRSLMEWPMGYFSFGPDDSNLPPYGLGVFVDNVNGTIYSGGDIGVDNGTQSQSTHASHWSWWPNALPGSVDVGVALICNNGKGSATLYSRAKDVVQALQATPDSRPVSTESHATSPDPARVHRGTWILDTSRAYVLAPDGLPALPGAIAPLALSADLQAHIATLTPAGGPAGGPTAPAGLLRDVTLSSTGRLEGDTGVVNVSFPIGTGLATVRLADAAMSLQVTDDAGRLFDGIVQGTLDARDFSPARSQPPPQAGIASLAFVPPASHVAATPSVSQICTAVRQAGSACTPCADGVRACFQAALGGIAGRRVGSSQPRGERLTPQR